MKSLMLTVLMIASISTGIVLARQERDLNSGPRMFSHQEGVSVGDQSNRPIDLNLAKKIRQELMSDSALSMKAKNINVIVANNGVTLKGTVNTVEEREVILKHAYTTAPKHRIYNQISVVK